MALEGRQRHRESRSVIRSAVDGDGAVMAIDDPFHQAQAQASAVGSRRTGGVGLVEALEGVRDHIGRHADPGVGDVDARALAVAAYTHDDASPFGRELHRVVEQVEEKTFELPGITERNDRGEPFALQVDRVGVRDRLELIDQ